MTQKQVGEHLRSIRKRAGITQVQVAEALGVSNESVSRMERGEQWPPFNVLVELAAVYELEVADLLTIPEPGNTSSKSAAIREIVNLLEARKTADAELARNLLHTLFDDPRFSN